MKMFDSEPPDNHHFQFQLMPKKTFSYSKDSDEFVLCLGKCIPALRVRSNVK